MVAVVRLTHDGRRVKQIYAGEDPTTLGAYPVPEAARLVGVPASTVHAWFFGQRSSKSNGRARFRPVLAIDDPEERHLSFRNLVELHVLVAIRRQYRIPLQRTRRAVEFMRKHLGGEHPLASRRMLTDGKDLLVREGSTLLNVSRSGQAEMDIVEAFLSRIEFNRRGELVRLFPFTTPAIEKDARAVVIDPRVQFGRPCLSGTGIPTEVVNERFLAGEGIEELAADYEVEPQQVEAAIRYERRSAA